MNNPNYKRSSLNLTRNNEPNQFSINPINTYSLKPISLIIPQDINVKEILKNMMKKLNFGGDKFYQYKKLTQSEITNRKTMIESMKKFLIENRIKCSVLYSTIFLFDILINKNKNKELSYEELALGALILSVKFSNEHNLFKSNKKNIFFNNNEYSFSESAEIEIICIKLLEYKLDFYHPIHFMEFLLLNGIIFNTDQINTEESYKVYSSALNILENIMYMDNKYLKYHPFYISCSIVCLCRENSNLEIWPFIFLHVFNIEFSMFKNVFDFISANYKSKNRNNNNNNNNNILSPSIKPITRTNSYNLNINLNEKKLYINNNNYIDSMNFNSPQKLENTKEEEKYKTPIKTISSQNNLVINLSLKPENSKNANSPSKIIRILSHLHRASSTDKKFEKRNYFNNSNKKQLLYYCQNYDKFEKEVNSNEPTMENSKRESLAYLSSEKVNKPNNIGLFKMNNFRQGTKFINVNKNNLNDSDFQNKNKNNNNNNVFDFRLNNSTRNYKDNQSISSERMNNVSNQKLNYCEKVKLIPEENYFVNYDLKRKNILNNYLNFKNINIQNQNLNKKIININNEIGNSSGIK